MSKTLIIVAVLAFVASSSGVYIKDCGSKSGKINVKDVQISSCGTGPFCILHAGTNVTIQFPFISLLKTKSVKAMVHGIIGGVPIPFPLPQSDACKNSGLKCPLQKNSKNAYKAELMVRSSYPHIHLQVKWELRDDSDQDIVCLLIPAEIR